MPQFRYSAENAQGQAVTGEVTGRDLAAVRADLEGHGLRIRELTPLSDTHGPISASDSLAVLQHVASSTASELPLVDSLRAFAEEVSPALRARLIRVCDALERGEPSEKVLADPTLRLPPSVSVILHSGLPHEAMKHLLGRAVRAATNSGHLHARAMMMVAYPLIMFSIMCGFWFFLLQFVTPQFKTIFQDFGTELPALTVQLINLSDIVRSHNWIYLLTLIPLALLGLVCWRFCLSKAARRRWWCGIPVIGAMYRQTALSEFARLLALMLETRVPLPQALKWSSAGVGDADLQERCGALAGRIENGEDPISASRAEWGIPSHLEQMLRWASHGAEGSEPLRTMARMLEARAKSLSLSALPLLEPVMLIAMAISIVAYVLMVFLPLIKLLNDLS